MAWLLDLWYETGIRDKQSMPFFWFICYFLPFFHEFYLIVFYLFLYIFRLSYGADERT